MRQGRGGRPSKGQRDHLVSRPALPIGTAVRKSAEEQGYDSVSDYIAAVLAQHEGLAHLAPPAVHARQEEALDISA